MKIMYYILLSMLSILAVLIFKITNIFNVVIILSTPLLVFISVKYPQILLSLLIIPTKYSSIKENFGVIDPLIIIFFLMAISVIFKTVYNKKFPKIPKEIYIPYVLLAITMLFSLLYTPNLKYGVEKFVEFISLTLFAGFSPFLLFKNKKDLDVFFYSLIVIGTIMSAIVLVTLKLNPLSLPEFGVFGANYLAIQNIAGVASLVLIFYFLQIRGTTNLRKAILIFVLILLLSGMIYAAGKAPIFNLFVSTFFISLLFIRKDKFNLFFPVLSLLIIISLVLTPVGDNLLRRTNDITTQDFIIKERTENLKIAFQLFIQNPFTGVGIGGFKNYSAIIDYGQYSDYIKIKRFEFPHNIFLEAASELGLIGLIMIVLILFFTIKKIFYLKKKYYGVTLLSTSLSLFLFIFLNALTSRDINNLALFALIGLIHSLKHLKTEE